jgi:M penetrans paralogue family 26
MEDAPRDIFSDSRIPLPNGTAVFVLGICSVLFSCICIGFILGIIGLLLSREGRNLYRQAPHLYEGYGLLHAGFILSIIGTVLGILSIAYFAIIFSFQAFYR